MKTKVKTFKPMLAPNDQPDLDEIKYPILASYKLDGIRCLFIKGEMLSRSLKPIVNKQLREKFEPIRKFSEEKELILDGEIYSHELTFQEITRYVMTQDFEDKKSIKKHGEVLKIPHSLKFHCFDIVAGDNFDEPYKTRSKRVDVALMDLNGDIYFPVIQRCISSKEEVSYLFEEAIKNNTEGLILKDFNGKYKCGRGTLKEGLIYKVKPFVTFDAQILDVIQATEVDPNAEKKINELGRSVTSKKKGDRILIDKASAFEVEYNNLCDRCLAEGKTGVIIKSQDKCGDCGETHRLKVVIAMTDEEKEDIWTKKSFYIGKTIEYKGMMIGSKDVPRHPVMIRFRMDKE